MRSLRASGRLRADHSPKRPVEFSILYTATLCLLAFGVGQAVRRGIDRRLDSTWREDVTYMADRVRQTPVVYQHVPFTAWPQHPGDHHHGGQ
jgi:hypothetical protein